MRILGLFILLIGVALQPLGWMYLPPLTLLSFLCIAGGVFLLLRNDDSWDGLERGHGAPMPGDVHGYNGQFAGGRSTGWESGFSHGGDAGHGGGGE